MKLLETIRYENGKFENSRIHQKRMNDSRKKLFGCTDKIDLCQRLEAWLPEALAGFTTGEENTGLFKCRVIYASEIEKIELIPYSLPTIRTLKIVVDDQMMYNHKYLNRARLETLFNQRDDCDDVLIVKNGLITDTSYANILFYNGRDWMTPASPLLKGTQRAKLLQSQFIKTADIRVEALNAFDKARIINAMIRFEDELDFQIADIKA